MRRVVLLVSCVVAVLLGLIALPVRAGEGRTPVFLDGTVIVSDGRYVLTRNIVSAGGGFPVINIAAAKVDLDLNGFTIFGAGGAPAILVSAPPVEVSIHGGTIVGGDQSISRPSPGASGRMVVVEDIRSQDSILAAIDLEDIENVAIRRNNIVDSGGPGIVLDGAFAFPHGEITHNAINRTAGDGIHVVMGGAMEISHNQIELAGWGAVGMGNGIFLGDSVGCLLLENAIYGPSADGIVLRRSRGNKLFDNIVRQSFMNGIHLDFSSRDNHIYRNVVTECGAVVVGAHGIHIESVQNDLSNNTSNTNYGCGLLFAGAFNVLRANTAQGNGLIPGSCPPPPACLPMFSPDSCDSTGGGNPTGEPVATNNMIPVPY